MPSATCPSGQSGNVRLVQDLYAAFARRDIPAVLAVLSPDAVWGEPSNPLDPSGGTRHGHAGFLEWVESGRGAGEILALEPRRFLSDEDSVAVVGYPKVLVRSTRKVYETDFVHLVPIRDGKITRFQEFFDTFAAAEAFHRP
jgi:ketosteroid isomerase-like protein